MKIAKNNLLRHINFNKDCIELYMKENINKNYNSKIYALLQENIELYKLLNRSKRKRVKLTPSKTNIVSDLKIRNAEYKEVTMQDFGFDTYQDFLEYNK